MINYLGKINETLVLSCAIFLLKFQNARRGVAYEVNLTIFYKYWTVMQNRHQH